MTLTVSKAGPYYASGEIKFSSLRSNFRAQVRKETLSGSETFPTDTAEIKASELLRITTITNSNPVVPDATENANISTSSNWKVSQFRNSIKYYYIAQTATEINLDIDTLSWNSNLNKTVRKFLFVGSASTCGSNDATIPAAHLNATAYNLTVDVYGDIFGAAGRGGGSGGGAPAISGQKGGDALQMTSTNGANNIVLVRSTGRIYAGGGGGEKGVTGADGANGQCYDAYTQGGGCGCPSCASGWTDGSCYQNYGNHCDRKQVCGCWGDCWWESNGDTFSRSCYKDYQVSGGSGGIGGNGGLGKGYNNLSGPSNGDSAGTPGLAQGCFNGGSYTTTPQQGKPGTQGGNGGDWNQEGGNTDNTGSGGAKGLAVFGSNYTVTGIVNSDTVKGAYTAS